MEADRLPPLSTIMTYMEQRESTHIMPIPQGRRILGKDIGGYTVEESDEEYSIFKFYNNDNLEILSIKAVSVKKR